MNPATWDPTVWFGITIGLLLLGGVLAAILGHNAKRSRKPRTPSDRSLDRADGSASALLSARVSVSVFALDSTLDTEREERHTRDERDPYTWWEFVGESAR
jgi:hypothetical protein